MCSPLQTSLGSQYPSVRHYPQKERTVGLALSEGLLLEQNLTRNRGIRFIAPCCHENNKEEYEELVHICDVLYDKESIEVELKKAITKKPEIKVLQEDQECSTSMPTLPWIL